MNVDCQLAGCRHERQGMAMILCGFKRTAFRHHVLKLFLAVIFGARLWAADWHQDGKGFRWRELEVPSTGKTGFTLLKSSETGLLFTNLLGEFEGEANRVLQNGSGLALGDYDGDGLPDAYFCSLNGESALYRNLGNWHFTNVTASAGVGMSNLLCRGATFADLDGDGKLDLLIALNGSGIACFQN